MVTTFGVVPLVLVAAAITIFVKLRHLLKATYEQDLNIFWWAIAFVILFAAAFYRFKFVRRFTVDAFILVLLLAGLLSMLYGSSLMVRHEYDPALLFGGLALFVWGIGHAFFEIVWLPTCRLPHSKSRSNPPLHPGE